MTDIARHDEDLDPALAEVFHAAYDEEVDVEVAARHLWVIHRAGQRVAAPTRARLRRTAVAALVGAIFMMMSTAALAASGSALPGDVLYPVKRGAERARLLFTVSSEADAKLHLALAQKRIGEAQNALQRARPAVVLRLVQDAITALEVAERVGGAGVAEEAGEVRRETSQQVVALAAALEDPDRSQVEESATRLAEEEPAEPTVVLVPTPDPEDPAQAENATATPATPTESATPTETADSDEADDTTTTTPSPSGSESPSESASASPSATPSESTSPSSSETPTPTPGSSPTPASEPTPAESSTPRRYESEGEETPVADPANPVTSPSPSVSPTAEPTESPEPSDEPSPEPTE